MRGESPESYSARRDLAMAGGKAAAEQLRALRKEQEEIPLLIEKLSMEKTVALNRQSALEKGVGPLRKAVAFLRREADNRLLAEKIRAARKASVDSPVLGEVAEEDRELLLLKSGGDDREGMREKIAAMEKRLQSAADKATIFEARLKNLKEKVRIVGLTDAVGLLMRRIRSGLPETRTIRKDIEERQEQIATVDLKRLELRDHLERLSDIKARVAEYMDRVRETDTRKRKEIEEGLRRHLLSIRTTLRGDSGTEGFVALYEQYAEMLSRLDMAQARFLEAVENTRSYIDRRILWIRSSKPVGAETLADALDHLGWLLNPSHWFGVVRVAWRDLITRPLVNIIVFFSILAVFIAGAKITRGFSERQKQPGDKTAAAMGRKSAELVGAGVAGMAWPLLLFWPAWRLDQAAGGAAFAGAVSSALRQAGVFIAPACIVHVLCRDGGVANKILCWPEAAVTTSRRAMKWLVVAGGVVVFVMVAIAGHRVPTGGGGLGRLCFIAAFVCIGLAAGALLRPNGRLARTTFAKSGKGVIYGSRHVWYPLAMVIPLALAGIGAMRYYYTATQLGGRLVVLFWFLMAVTILYSWVMSWVAIARHRLAEKIAGAERKKGPDASGVDGQDAGGEPDRDELHKSFVTISRRSRSFVNYITLAVVAAGFWLIWVDVLPALGYLEKIELWSTMLPDGSAIAVTLADVLLAVLLVIVTITAGRNFPSLLEMSVLRKLHVESGAGYAISALVRYCIYSVGFVAAFYAIGVTWSHVQWLVAALSLGLGFGLQEIFANFVSGLIILVERPIRKGDTITVGGIMGTVSRIKARATTIVDWDRKEIIIPNKQFITGELINWTLSDEVLRVIIPVGIAYGSDTAEAQRQLLRVAAENGRVQEDPPPTALFLGFGDSSLNFELRVFVTGIQDYLPVQDEIHMAIDAAFREAGIVIAFPQHDLHIRSLPEGASAGDMIPKNTA